VSIAPQPAAPAAPGPDALPAPTRMLLGSDGSTSVLLESLLRTRVAVHVDSQRACTRAEVSDHIAGLLGLTGGQQAVLRRSRLLTPDQRVVSINRVVFRADLVPWLAAPPDSTPLGLKLRDLGSLQHRVLLASGIGAWPPDAAPCGFKEYLIHGDQGEEIYVHESFNPALIALDAERGTR
jgi:hypothetical protein